MGCFVLLRLDELVQIGLANSLAIRSARIAQAIGRHEIDDLARSLLQ